ncbi:efflux ABC transporter, permease protein [Gemella haemolysans]|uniref:Putative hemin transport system permease protein HrtB n=1 Tax=Gemella haemolysans TaxID=1379 RepID=A0A133ZWM9_9BACL|nr:ABC transporter permease [Gemella haemolysans]KXB59836.1 efflux ABC transporter, permease protein [Gemella haemolysans]
MFLAINEIKDAKLRYSLIVGLLTLVSYLMFFLSGLAFGLIDQNRSYIDHWRADTVLLSSEANKTIGLSNLKLSDKKSLSADNVEPFSQMVTVSKTEKSSNEDVKQKVSIFGVNNGSFLIPPVIQGRIFESKNEVVIEKSLSEKEGYSIGDTIKTANSDIDLKIVGYTEKSRFNVAPVIYMNINDFQILKYGVSKTTDNPMINAFVVKGELKDYDSSIFQKVSIADFINELPGYSAQILTFGLMIGFLIVISAIIIGIFMYVLTIQKTPIFGIMKAQGISNGIIGISVLSQTFLLSLAGSILGLVGTWGTLLVLPSAVPFLGNGLYYSIIFVSLIIFSLVGTLFSVLAIRKIDPLKAIG